MDITTRTSRIRARSNNYNRASNYQVAFDIRPVAKVIAPSMSRVVMKTRLQSADSAALLPYQFGQTFQSSTHDKLTHYKGMSPSKIITHQSGQFENSSSAPNQSSNIDLFDGTLNEYIQSRQTTRNNGDIYGSKQSTLTSNPYKINISDRSEPYPITVQNDNKSPLIKSLPEWGETVTESSQLCEFEASFPLSDVVYWCKNIDMLPLYLTGTWEQTLEIDRRNSMVTLTSLPERIAATRTGNTTFTMDQLFTTRESLKLCPLYVGAPLKWKHGAGSAYVDGLTVASLAHNSTTGVITVTVAGGNLTAGGDNWVEIDNSGVQTAEWEYDFFLEVTELVINPMMMKRTHEKLMKGQSFPFVDKHLIRRNLDKSNEESLQIDIPPSTLAVVIMLQKQLIETTSDYSSNRRNKIPGRDGMGRYRASIDDLSLTGEIDVFVGRTTTTVRSTHNYLIEKALKSIGQQLKRYDAPLVNYNVQAEGLLDPHDAYDGFMIALSVPMTDKTQVLNIEFERTTGNFTADYLICGCMRLNAMEISGKGIEFVSGSSQVIGRQ